MATRAEQIRRHQEAQAARQRVKSGVYMQPQSAPVNPRTEAVRDYYVEDKPWPELQQSMPDSLKTLNPIASSTLMGAINGNPQAQQTYKQASGLTIAPIQGPPAPPKPTEYDSAKQDIEKLSPYNPVRYYATAMNWLTQGNPVGRFANRIGRAADSVIGTPATIDTSTGNKVADKTADVIGSLAGIAVPIAPGVPDVNLASGPVKLAEGALSSRVGQNLVGAAGRGLERTGLNAGMANRLVQNTAVGIGAGALGNAALSAVQGNTSAGELGHSAAEGALFGGALGATGGLLSEQASKLLSKFTNRIKDEQSLNNTRVSSLPESNLLPPTMARLEKQPGLNSILEQIKPIVTERMTPPYESKNELARWLQGHFGNDVPLNEIKALGYEQMRLLAEEIRPQIDLETTVRQVASELGYDYDKLLSPKRAIPPDLISRAKQTQELRDVYGVPSLVKTASDRAANSGPGKIADITTEPILRPGQFEEQRGLGISAFSRTKPYDSLPTDTRSQLVTRQQKEATGLSGTASRLYTKLVDDLYPLQQQDKIIENIVGKSLPASEQTHTLGLASRGADVIAKRMITDGLVDSQGNVVGDSLKSILKGLPAKKKDIYVDFEDYLINKHAITRADRGENVFDKKLKWTPEYGAQKVAEYEQMFPEFKETADKLYEFQKGLVNNWLVDTGIISPEQAQAWFDANPYYVPNKRQFTSLEKASGGKTRSKKGFGNQSVPVKAYGEGGSQRKIISPIEAVIENVDAFVKTAKRNQVMQTYVKNIERDPEAFSDWAEIVKQPEKPEDITKMLLDGDGLDELLSRFDSDFDSAVQRTKLDKDNVVRVLVNGDPVHVKIKDQQLLDAITALGPEQSNFFINGVGRLTNTMKTLTTGANPVFSLTRNIFRDIPQAYIASKTRDNPVAFATDLISAALDIGRKRGAYKDYLNMGGGHASSIAASRNLLAQSKASVLPQNTARGIIPKAYRGLENVLNTVEVAPRLAEFKRVGKQTGDWQKAIYEAQDVTTNFKRRGSLTRTIDKFFPYFNAAVQGLDQVVRVYKDNPVKSLVKSAIALSLPAMALYAINYDNPDYKKLNNRTKDAFFLIPKGDGTFIKIAKPQEQGTIFTDLPERFMRLFYEQDPTAFRDFADRLRTTFLPPGLQGLLNGSDVISGVVNDTIFGPAVQTISNKSWNGSAIVPGNLANLSPGLQSDARTSALATKLGQTINYSPKKIDYLISQYGGVLGQLGLPAMSPGGDLGYSLQSQITADPVFSNDLSTEFYHYKDKLDQAKTDAGAGKDYPGWYNDGLRKQMGRISDQMSKIRTQIRATQGDGSLSNADKRQKLRGLQDSINALADQGSSIARDRVPY